METKFEGTWGGVFVASFVMGLFCIIPIVGFAMGYCYFQKYMTSNTVIGGKKLEFTGTWNKLWVPLFITGLLSWIPGLAMHRITKMQYENTAVVG